MKWVELQPILEVCTKEEGGRGTGSLRNVLPRGGTGGATIWVVDLGVDGSNYAKTRGGTREFSAAGDGDEGSKAGG